VLKLRRLELKGAVEEKASQKLVKKSNEMKWKYKDNNLWLLIEHDFNCLSNQLINV
jgi:hypothetical protein